MARAHWRLRALVRAGVWIGLSTAPFLFAGLNSPALSSELSSEPISSQSPPAAASKLQPPASYLQSASAAKLIEAALRHEIDGNDSRREVLLTAALYKDPNHAAALWHSGYIEHNGDWFRIDDPFLLSRRNRALKEYRRRRNHASVESVEEQLALARWCEAHGLADQARAHFSAVVALEPDHRVARARLGHRRIDGRWISSEDGETAEARARRDRRALRRHKGKMTAIKNGLARRDSHRRRRVEKRLLAVDDPSAIPAMEQVVSTASYDGAMLVVETLSNMNDYEASVALVRQAVLSEWTDARDAAAEALLSRHWDHYVPTLLDAMQTPVESELEIMLDRRGRLVSRHTVYREERDRRRLAVFDTVYPRRSSRGGAVAEILSRQRRTTVAQNNARAREREIARENATARDRNASIAHVLAMVTGQTLAAAPQSWWAWWLDYNGMSRQGEKPLETTYARRNVYVPEPTWREINSFIARSTSTSCFAAGTGVWTETGMAAIETVQVGDRVLSQDVDTGRLEYRPVLQTTVRPARRLLELAADGETFRVTKGHPFWVTGRGWTVAHKLEPGSRLHRVSGTAAVDSVTAATYEPTYNLVVADFHTYFVGDWKLLCHDNSERKATNVVVPGLVAKN